MDEAERKRLWALENIVAFELKFNKDRDADILSKLETVDSRQGYLRMLIRNDLIQKGIIKGNLESYNMFVHRGRDRVVKHNVRASIRLVNGGPDQPIIDYLRACPNKIDYIRELVRKDIDAGGTVSERVTTQKGYIDVDTVTASVERTAKLLGELSQQDRSESGEADKLIKAINQWINRS